MNNLLTRTIAGLALLALVSQTPLLAETPANDEAGVDRPVIEVQYQGPIKAVYQVTEDVWKDGVGKAFLYLKNLRGYYEKQGFDMSTVDLRAVVHGDASYHVLTDEAYNRVKQVATGNPNAKILSELKQLGVHIELCDTRRQQEGWAKSDIHPDVLLAKAAYARLIDLQLQGYAYIKF